jgi:hypothetical protein
VHIDVGDEKYRLYNAFFEKNDEEDEEDDPNASRQKGGLFVCFGYVFLIVKTVRYKKTTP